jgi:Mor family transcriptional regulator
MRNTFNLDAGTAFEILQKLNCKSEALCEWLTNNPGEMRKVYWNKLIETHEALEKWLTDEVGQPKEEAKKLAVKFAEDEIMYSNE